MSDETSIVQGIVDSRKASIAALEVQVADLEAMAKDSKRTPAAQAVFRAQAKVKRQRLTRLRGELEALMAPQFEAVASMPNVRKGG